ncbi:MAG: hypothetical protein A3F67_08120 [Verrucomicrobia bacterium RIFCSPHIGHO2_12_FULL_41_10]|nr:MAG: hypothetical protein A3F67_08120 [Verrucomicrobia bacterium RIFCSPHIGHO2_12_FULL_41_10]
MQENVKISGNVAFKLVDENGNIKEQFDHNLVVDTGLAYIASRMKDATATAMSHMAIGTSSTAAADAQTALITEAARVAFTSSTIVTTTVTNDSVQYVGTFGAGVGTGAITEAGIFNAATVGTMLSRTVFSVINKGASDSLTITWTVTAA